MELSLYHIRKRAQEAEGVVIVGAGHRGKDMFTYLKNNGIVVKSFFDNNTLIGTGINNIEVLKPHKIEENGILYIIAVESVEMCNELHAQLIKLGVEDNDIVAYYRQNYDFLKNLDKKYYKEAIDNMYYDYFGRKMDWENPSTYNEIINWEKLNIRDERRTRLADKLLVKDWVREQIGEKYITKLYGSWNDAEDIDFNALPNQFVLKLNNGSGRNIVVKDKNLIDRTKVCRQLNEWKNFNFAYKALELHYRDINPKIICEEYLDGVADNVYDYNIYCFQGEPMYIWCIKGSHKPDCKASFYNKDWKMMPFVYRYPKDNIVAPKPEKLEEMLNLCRILSKGFKHVRVDWYNLPDGRVLFGEMTFSTCAGLRRFEPEEYDNIFANLIKGNSGEGFNA